MLNNIQIESGLRLIPFHHPVLLLLFSGWTDSNVHDVVDAAGVYETPVPSTMAPKPTNHRGRDTAQEYMITIFSGMRSKTSVLYKLTH